MLMLFCITFCSFIFFIYVDVFNKIVSVSTRGGEISIFDCANIILMCILGKAFRRSFCMEWYPWPWIHQQRALKTFLQNMLYLKTTQG
jgi:hypothetical protein